MWAVWSPKRIGWAEFRACCRAPFSTKGTAMNVTLFVPAVRPFSARWTWRSLSVSERHCCDFQGGLMHWNPMLLLQQLCGITTIMNVASDMLIQVWGEASCCRGVYCAFSHLPVMQSYFLLCWYGAQPPALTCMRPLFGSFLTHSPFIAWELFLLFSPVSPAPSSNGTVYGSGNELA